MSRPLRYIVASRSGLFLVNEARWKRVAEGQYFGVTVRGQEIYCFEAATDAEKRVGRIVRYRLADETLIEPLPLVEGLDNGCHQVDFFDGAFFVVDTYNQAILEFDEDWQLAARHRPLPPAAFKQWTQGYVHMNSLLGRGRTIFLMLHKGGPKGTGERSEILVLDRAFRIDRRLPLDGYGCHDIVELEGGRLLCCDSQSGRLIHHDGDPVPIDELMTRGLAVSPDEIAVGSSLFDERPHRLLIPGFVTFLDRSFNRIGRLHLPAAPTQIRRLDGEDLSLSQPRPWQHASAVAAGDPAQEKAG
ncbi:MAG TPA: hypothetical protein VGV37_09235 [Aliidongia sp.]|uniref:hypothetical protein n=1 Tax=Aliidongia sp. TaxID=1914230 RepID=UPI002DDD065D|nr:hypothetical protein [Aliidongia sp.]HEV2674713.1 hypothetical protein [Aliidongia sp.]